MNLKRIALGLVVVILLLLAGGGGWWWWMHRTGPSAADYLPETTFLFFHIPNAEATREAYATSHLKKLLQSSEISSLSAMVWKEATEKARPEDVAKTKDASGLWQLFERNLTGEAFLAITQADFQNPGNNRFVAGVRPKQGLGDIPPLVARIKQLSAESMKGAPTGKGNHGGVDFEWIDLEGKAKLYFGAVGPWEIVAVGEPAFFDFIDRYQAKGKTPGSLSQSAVYKKVLSRLPGRQDAVAYLSFDAIKPTLITLLGSQAQLKKDSALLQKAWAQLQGFGWGGKFENGRIRETIVSLMPKATRPDLGKTYEACAYKTLPMTSSQTYIYMAQNFDLRKYWDYSLNLYNETNPDVAAMMKQAPEWAKAQGLDFNKNLLDALGPECAVLLDWPGDALVPDFALIFDVANQADLKPTIDYLVNTLSPFLAMDPNGGKLEDGKVGDYTLKTYRSPKMVMVSPTLITSGDKFGFILTQSGAKRMLTGNADSLAKQEAFKAVGGDKHAGTISLAYINFGGLVDHIYVTAKPYMSLAAMMSPELQKLVGSGKMPDKLSFTGDLGSWLTLSSVDDDGATVRSLSNTGNLPLVVGGASLITVAALQQGKAKSSPNAPIATASDLTADGVKAELEELRAVIEAYAVAQDIPKGTVVTWAAISTYLVPESPLQKRGGKDVFGHDFLLGIVGQTPADVAPETKAKFADHDENFWKAPTAAGQ